jgi:hypothetical protein
VILDLHSFTDCSECKQLLHHIVVGIIFGHEPDVQKLITYTLLQGTNLMAEVVS